MTSFDEMDVEALKRWLLISLATRRLTPAPTMLDPSINVQIQTMYSGWQPETKERFKSAVSMALAEWSDAADDDPFELLRDLALIAAYVKASATVPQLATIVRNRLTPPDTEERADVVDTLLSVIAGFAPLGSAVAACESFYYDTALEAFTAVTITGLIRAYPERFPDYLPAMLHILERHPDWFEVGQVLDRVIRSISPTILAAHVAELDDDSLKRLLKLLNSHPLVRAKFEQDEIFGCIMISSFSRVSSVSHIGPRPKDAQSIGKVKRVIDSMIAADPGVAGLKNLLESEFNISLGSHATVSM